MAVNTDIMPIIADEVSVRLGDTQALDAVSIEAEPGRDPWVDRSERCWQEHSAAGASRSDTAGLRLQSDLAARPLRRMNAGERARRIAYMPQHDANHAFTALETVLMGRYPHLGRFELEGRRDRKIARAAMERTETVRFESRQLDRLSGGERQRVVLARALAQRADVFLLDEPSSSLDLRYRLSIMETLRKEIELRQVTVVVALHDVFLAGRYCDRLALMSDGGIDSVGEPGDVLTTDNLRRVFGVETTVQRDPETGSPQVWLVGPTP